MAYDLIDIHVGARIRYLRKSKKISQGDLSSQLGITFQQIQKYEKGANRVSSSMLFRISQFLQEPVSYFFSGLEGQPGCNGAEKVDVMATAAAVLVPSILRISELSSKECAVIDSVISAMLPKVV